MFMTGSNISPVYGSKENGTDQEKYKIGCSYEPPGHNDYLRVI